MKLLLDENLSRRIIIPFIQEIYPGSTQVALAGSEQSDDKIIRQYAIDNDFIMVTKDADFFEMDMLYGPPPKIIWLKIGNQSKIVTKKVCKTAVTLLNRLY